MSNPIHYNTRELKIQWGVVAKSRMDAIKKIAAERYCKTTGLDENDPPELWRFAVGFTERPPALTKSRTTNQLAKHFRQVDPQFAGSPENYERFRNSVGKPTLRETVSALTACSNNDADLANWLTKLLAIFKRSPISHGKDSDDKTKQLLLDNWIQEPFGNITGSLAFFSDRAMAKMIYLLVRRQWLPAMKLSTEPERIRKTYLALNLRPAQRRAIKDLDYQAGKIHFILNKTRTPRGR